MLPEVLLRPAEVTDTAPAAAVLLTSRRAAGAAGAIPRGVHLDAAVQTWFADEVMVSRDVWVAEGADGIVVAVLVLDDGWLDHLYVLPDSYGQGIGTAMLAMAKALRPAGFDLWVFASNLPAQRFYEAQGCVEVDRTDGSGNEEGAADIRYRWQGLSVGAGQHSGSA